jgi:serine/threonine protein kinase
MGDVLPPGTRLGRYEIVQRLALGGMAEIYLARMSGLAGFAKHVVLKRILPSHARDAEFVRMFFNEARYAATLDHPNIAHVYDLGEEQGLHYFTMEYLHGEDCRTLLRELSQRSLSLPLEHALTIVVGAATGCHFAHELTGDDGHPLGLIHRDVSPSNVVVTYAGAVKLVDFGIAKATNLEDVTAVGVTKGKLAYMAPEQCRGESLDRRVDVYALGVLMYELATQRRAFAGQNDAQVMWAVITGEVPPPSTHKPDLAPTLEAIIKRAMDVDRTKRYATARELSQAVEAFARESGLTLNPAALGEFLERTMGPKLEPWRAAEREGKGARAKTPLPSSSLAMATTLPSGASADTPTFAPMTPPGGNARAATNTVTEASSPDGATRASREAETAAEMAVTTPRVRPGAPEAPAGRSPVLPIIAAVAVAGALILGTLWWRDQRAKDDRDDPVVLVAERGSAALEGAADAAAATDDPDAGVAAAVVDGGRPIDAGARGGTAKPLSLDEQISRAFAKRQPQVNKCFNDHPGIVLQTPTLKLKFSIGTDGVPTKVGILEADVGNTPLGQCIIDVGRGTRFPKVDAPMGFTIPLSVRSRRGAP